MSKKPGVNSGAIILSRFLTRLKCLQIIGKLFFDLSVTLARVSLVVREITPIKT
jgi:hypothetical protein